VAHSLVHRIHLVCTLLQLYYVMHERAVSRMYRNRDVYWTKVQYTTYAATIVILGLLQFVWVILGHFMGQAA
jgi:hypothetical protein